MLKNIINYCVIAAVAIMIVIVIVMVTQDSTMAQIPGATTTNFTKYFASEFPPRCLGFNGTLPICYPIVSVLYQSDTMLVLKGDLSLSNGIWSAVETAKQQEGYKMDGMSAYSYQTGDPSSAYRVSEIVIVAMSK
jgi:hypothetical protein